MLAERNEYSKQKIEDEGKAACRIVRQGARSTRTTVRGRLSCGEECHDKLRQQVCQMLSIDGLTRASKQVWRNKDRMANN